MAANILQEAKNLVYQILTEGFYSKWQNNIEHPDLDVRTAAQHAGAVLADKVRLDFNLAHRAIVSQAPDDCDHVAFSKTVKIELSRALIEQLAGSSSRN